MYTSVFRILIITLFSVMLYDYKNKLNSYKLTSNRMMLVIHAIKCGSVDDVMLCTDLLDKANNTLLYQSVAKYISCFWKSVSNFFINVPIS
jgi:hypothetical protein